MSLTLDQYNEIKRVLDDRRMAALREQEKRQEEIEERLPAVKALNGEIAGLSGKEAGLRLKKAHAAAEALKKERLKCILSKKELLKGAGYPEDYLEVKYFCKKCRDTGYIGNEKCGCFKKLWSEMLNRGSGLPLLMEKENFSTIDISLYDDAGPLEEFLPRRITQRGYMAGPGGVLDKVYRYVDRFGEAGGNILMFGAPGTGKTFLCNCIARELIERQHAVSYRRAGEMMDRLTKTGFSREPDPGLSAMNRQDEESELLIIDDLGTEYATDVSKARFFSVISNRLSLAKSTIISTNLSMNQICQAYGERVSSRFMGEYMLLPFYGSDLRMAKGN